MKTDIDGNWSDLYKIATLEFDPQRLPERITLANGAIDERLRELDHFSNEVPERRNLLNASRNLHVLAHTWLHRWFGGVSEERSRSFNVLIRTKR